MGLSVHTAGPNGNGGTVDTGYVSKEGLERKREREERRKRMAVRRQWGLSTTKEKKKKKKRERPPHKHGRVTELGTHTMRFFGQRMKASHVISLACAQCQCQRGVCLSLSN